MLKKLSVLQKDLKKCLRLLQRSEKLNENRFPERELLAAIHYRTELMVNFEEYITGKISTVNDFSKKIPHAVCLPELGAEIAALDEINYEQVSELLAKFSHSNYLNEAEFITLEFQIIACLFLHYGAEKFHEIDQLTKKLYQVKELDFAKLISEFDPLEATLKEDDFYGRISEKTQADYRYKTAVLSQSTGISQERLAREFMQRAAKENKHVGEIIFDDFYRVFPLSKPNRLLLGVLIPTFIVTIITAIFCGLLPAIISIIPLIGAVLPLVHLYYARSFPPRALPRMAITPKLLNDNRTICVISTLFSNENDIKKAIESLKVARLKNGSGIIYAVLADLPAADTQKVKSDYKILNLCERYAQDNDVFIFVRPRVYCKTQQKWQGFDRKRGAIEELTKCLCGYQHSLKIFSPADVDEQARTTPINTKNGTIKPFPSALKGIKFMAALDYDTMPLMYSIAELVAIAAHPCCQKFGIIAPRITSRLSSSLRSDFAKIMAGNGGCSCASMYDNFSGEFYFDSFGSSIFCGKGLINLRTFYELCGNVFTPEKTLSHDILEGELVRTAFAGDVEFTDSFPHDSNAYFKRDERWVRGDFQNASWLFSKKLGLLSKVKIADNIRRALAPIFTILTLFCSLLVPNGLLLTLIAIFGFTMPFLLSIFPSFLNFSAARLFYSPVLPQSKLVLSQLLMATISLPILAFNNLIALIKTIWRTCFSKKNLLEWTASSVFERGDKSRNKAKFNPSYLSGSVISLALFIYSAISLVVATNLANSSAVPLIFTNSASNITAAVIVTIVAAIMLSAIPVLIAADREYRFTKPIISPSQRKYLLGTATDMFAFYTEYVTEKQHFLPPDNVQFAPVYRVAERTSPTNIGMYLLSCVSAALLDIISADLALQRISSTIDTVLQLEKAKGNLYNWYDTVSLKPLDTFVSSVDSGNFICCLVAVRQYITNCINNDKYDDLLCKINRIIEETDLSIFYNKRKKLFSVGVNVIKKAKENSSTSATEKSQFEDYLENSSDRIENFTKNDVCDSKNITDCNISDSSEESSEIQEKSQCFDKYKDKLTIDITDSNIDKKFDEEVVEQKREEKSAENLRESHSSFNILLEKNILHDKTIAYSSKMNFSDSIIANRVDSETSQSNIKENVKNSKNDSISEKTKAILCSTPPESDESDEEFQTLPNYYDLLMSEARMLSFYAIGTGYADLEHWRTLGRTMSRCGRFAGPVAWTGTMFEYFMPELLLSSKEGSMPREALRYAVFCQKRHAASLKIPFGMSESAYHAFDENLNYCYKAHGVQKNALKSGMDKDLVVSPYSSFLTLAIDFHDSLNNLRLLEKFGLTKGNFGFFEAIDFTPERAAEKKPLVVQSYMAHHVGMSIAGVANALCDNVLQSLFMSDSAAVTADQLLEEKIMSGEKIVDIKHHYSSKDRFVNEVVTYSVINPEQPRVNLLSTGPLSLVTSDNGICSGFFENALTIAPTRDLLRRPSGCYFGFSEQNLAENSEKNKQSSNEILHDSPIINSFTPLFSHPAFPVDSEFQVTFSPSDSVYSVKTKTLSAEMRLFLHSDVITSLSSENTSLINQSVKTKKNKSNSEKSVTDISANVAERINAEIRCFNLQNSTALPRTINFCAYIEPVLAPYRDYSAHPAFSKLFLKLHYDARRNVIITSRKERSGNDTLFAAIGFANPSRHFHYCFDREQAVERNQLFSFARKSLTKNIPNCVPDPCILINSEINLAKNSTESLILFTCYGHSEHEVCAAIDSLRQSTNFDSIGKNNQSDGITDMIISDNDDKLKDSCSCKLPFMNNDKHAQSVALTPTNVFLRTSVAGQLALRALPYMVFRSQPQCAISSSAAKNSLDKRALWRFSISGDLPLIVFMPSVGCDHEEVVQTALRLKQSLVDCSIKIDLVIICETEQQKNIAAKLSHETGIIAHIFEKNSLKIDELNLILASAAYVYDGYYSDSPITPPPVFKPFSPCLPFRAHNEKEGFSNDGSSYSILQKSTVWSNIIASPQLGTLVSQSALGFSYALNSHENKLTPWFNDPMLDNSGEMLLCFDGKMGNGNEILHKDTCKKDAETANGNVNCSNPDNIAVSTINCDNSADKISKNNKSSDSKRNAAKSESASGNTSDDCFFDLVANAATRFEAGRATYSAVAKSLRFVSTVDVFSKGMGKKITVEVANDTDQPAEIWLAYYLEPQLNATPDDNVFIKANVHENLLVCTNPANINYKGALCVGCDHDAYVACDRIAFFSGDFSSAIKICAAGEKSKSSAGLVYDEENYCGNLQDIKSENSSVAADFGKKIPNKKQSKSSNAKISNASQSKSLNISISKNGAAATFSKVTSFDKGVDVTKKNCANSVKSDSSNIAQDIRSASSGNHKKSFLEKKVTSVDDITQNHSTACNFQCSPHIIGAVIVPLKLPPRSSETITYILGYSMCSEKITDLYNSLQILPTVYETSPTKTSPKIKTHDFELDALFNHWLPAQTIFGRLYARTGFYQNGGAYGFRDQLQDSLLTLYSHSSIAKRQILRCCGAQFSEGDVLHWWHNFQGKISGVRTRYSDDLLWLPYLVCEYIDHTDDNEILNIPVRFCCGEALNPDEHEKFMTVSHGDFADVYHHCTAAINHSFKTGTHDLLKIGCGDWNDSYNNVGIGGKGESVWLTMFYITVCNKFIKIANLYKDFELAKTLENRIVSLYNAIDKHAWDGDHYLRAFYDDGEPMGSENSDACKIDSLPQSFATLCGVPDDQRNLTALNTAYDALVDEKSGIVKLFDPPFTPSSSRRAGYVMSYPSGVRENGGQYTHAAVWFALACFKAGQEQRGEQILSFLNPAKRLNYANYDRYRNEPFFISADIYTNPECYGHGGWSIYTGASAWYYKAVAEGIFGVKNGKCDKNLPPELKITLPKRN